MKDKPLFIEHMTMRESPFFKPLNIICGVSLVLTILCFIVTLIIPESAQKAITQSLLLFSILLIGVFSWLIWRFSISVEIYPDYLRFRAKPFLSRWRRIPFELVDSWSVRKFHPVTSLLGYGIKYNFFTGSWGYSISGDYALFLRKKSGRLILLGTWTPRSLKKTLEEVVGEKQNKTF